MVPTKENGSAYGSYDDFSVALEIPNGVREDQGLKTPQEVIARDGKSS